MPVNFYSVLGKPSGRISMILVNYLCSGNPSERFLSKLIRSFDLCWMRKISPFKGQNKHISNWFIFTENESGNRLRDTKYLQVFYLNMLPCLRRCSRNMPIKSKCTQEYSKWILNCASTIQEKPRDLLLQDKSILIFWKYFNKSFWLVCNKIWINMCV